MYRTAIALCLSTHDLPWLHATGRWCILSCRGSNIGLLCPSSTAQYLKSREVNKHTHTPGPSSCISPGDQRAGLDNCTAGNLIRTQHSRTDRRTDTRDIWERTTEANIGRRKRNTSRMHNDGLHGSHSTHRNVVNVYSWVTWVTGDRGSIPSRGRKIFFATDSRLALVPTWHQSQIEVGLPAIPSPGVKLTTDSTPPNVFAHGQRRSYREWLIQYMSHYVIRFSVSILHSSDTATRITFTHLHLGLLVWHPLDHLPGLSITL